MITNGGNPSGLGPKVSNESNSVTIATDQTAIPVSASTLPLPTGAATETTVASVNTKLPSGLTVKAASTPAVATDQALVVAISPNNPITANISNASIEISNDVGNPIPVNGTVTANLGTIAGASTSALQTTGNASLSSIDTKLNNLDIRDLVFATDKVDITGSTVTLDSTSLAALENITATVSGDINLSSATLTALETISVNNFPATQAVSAASLPLPTGAATSALQSTQDASINSLLKPSSTLAAVTTVSAVTAITNALPAGTNSIGQVTANAGTNLNTSALALETTQSAINTKLPSGLTVKAASTAAVAADQALVVTLSPNNPVTATISNASIEISNDVGNPIPVNGTITANLGTIAGVATETTLSSLNTKVPTGLTVTSGRLQVELPSGAGGLTDAELRASPVPVTATISGTPTVTVGNASLPVTGTFFQATQPVSIASSVAVTGPLTDTQLRASAVPVSLTSTTISNFPATQAVSAASLPLPTGAATSALQSTIDTSINTLLKPASTLNAVTTVGSVTSITNALPTGTNSIGQVTANAGTNLNTSALALEATQADIRTSVQLLDNMVGSVAAGAAGTNSGLTGGVFNTTLPTLTNGQQAATQVDNKGRFLNPTSNGRISYTLTTGTLAAGFLAGATANQDIFRISGSATKTVYIKKIRISATANATQGNNIAVIKRSAANTGGTSVASVLIPLDSTSVAATASAVHYTAAPTSGTAVGPVRATKFVIPTITSLYNPEIIFQFNENNGNPLVLNGTTQGLGIILNTAPGAGNNFLINVEWDEE